MGAKRDPCLGRIGSRYSKYVPPAAQRRHLALVKPTPSPRAPATWALDDVQLIAAVREGDEDAGELLYERLHHESMQRSDGFWGSATPTVKIAFRSRSSKSSGR